MTKYTFILIFFVSFSCFARIIEGYVYDNDDKLSLPSFQVSLLGGKEIEYTYTDSEGHFEFYIPHNDTIHIRFQNVGFVTMDIVDIGNEEKINLGKVYVHLNSYLRTLTYDKEKKVILPKGARINPKKMDMLCSNNQKIHIPLIYLFREIEENKEISEKYKKQFGLRREEFYLIRYTELVEKCD